jgi:hypothetical protein
MLKQTARMKIPMNVRREEFEIFADYHFTEQEKADIAQNLAKKQLRIGELEGDKKAITSQISADINRAKADVNLMSHQLNTGRETRKYTCHLDFDREKKLRLWKDKVTGKVVKEEPMRPEDFQMKIEELEGSTK